MPLNAAGWTNEENEKLTELVKPNPHLYNFNDPSRKNILARITTWQEIANQLSRPVEECKKRWRGLRDGYMRNKRMGTVHRTKIPIFEKLQFLDSVNIDDLVLEDPFESSEVILPDIEMVDGQEQQIGSEQQVITDGQEYEVSEITLIDRPQEEIKPVIKLVSKMPEPIDAKKIRRRNAGRKKAATNFTPDMLTPVKILPKPIIMSGEPPRVVRCIEKPKIIEPKSQALDRLIERVLKENTNEIDVFFRSMAASVKKLQPNLIPKVKMEVCNVIARYEMQNFDRTN